MITVAVGLKTSFDVRIYEREKFEEGFGMF